MLLFLWGGPPPLSSTLETGILPLKSSHLGEIRSKSLPSASLRLLPSHLQAVSSLHWTNTYTSWGRSTPKPSPDRPVWCPVVRRRGRGLGGVGLPCVTV